MRGEVPVRRDQRLLGPEEKRRFVAAVLRLKRDGGYDEFVRTHIAFYDADGEGGPRVAHMAPTFLPWHRRFLMEFERRLRLVDPSVTVPYWDWTRDRGLDTAPWTEDFLGGDGRASDLRVTTGPFARDRGDWIIRDGVTEDDFLTRNLGRPEHPLDLPTAGDLARATRQTAYDTEPWDSTSPAGFRNVLEGWTVRGDRNAWFNHNRVHRWVGGLMLGGAAVNDPVFWLHHCFLDLVWSRWQRANPRAGLLPAAPLGPDDDQYGLVLSRDEPMPPWDTRPSEVEDHSAFYRYED